MDPPGNRNISPPIPKTLEQTMHKHTNKKADPRTRNLRIGQCVFVQWEDYRALDISTAQDQALDCTQ